MEIIKINNLKLRQYWDIGDSTWKCNHCGAMIWNEERTKKDRRSSQPTFSLCCMHGKVKLQLLKDPLHYLKELLENKDSNSRHFGEHILDV